MRTFDVFFKYKKRKLVYKRLTGLEALELMKSFAKFNPLAFTEANKIQEVLTTEEMQTIYIN